MARRKQVLAVVHERLQKRHGSALGHQSEITKLLVLATGAVKEHGFEGVPKLVVSARHYAGCAMGGMISANACTLYMLAALVKSTTRGQKDMVLTVKWTCCAFGPTVK